jgi:hypothetical protein
MNLNNISKQAELLTNSNCVNINNENDDDIPQLSAEALKALQEFYAESQYHQDNLDENWVHFQK